MELTFQLGNEFIMVRIIGHNITFANSLTNFQTFVPIDCLMLSTEGILKEHPDLKDKPNIDIRKEAIRRFKEHIKAFPSEIKTKDYIVSELMKYGWILKNIRAEGFRDVKIK